MKAFVLALLVFYSGSSFAADYSNGMILQKLEKNPVVVGAFKQAQTWAGKKSTCKSLELSQLKVNGDTAHFEVFGRCSSTSGVDGQFTIQGLFDSPDLEPLIETVEFAYAG